MRSELAAPILATVVTLAGRAAAQAPASSSAPAPSVRLSWVRSEGAEQCLGAAELSRAVASRLGRDPFGLVAPRSIEGVVSRDDGRWRARVFVRDDRGGLVGLRELESEELSCAALGDAVALTIALAIDPDAAIRAASATPQAPSSPAAPSAAPSAPAAAPRSRASTAFSRDTSVTLRGVAAAGLLPGFAPGFALGANALAYGDFVGSTSILVLPEQSTDNDGGHFSFGLVALSFGACGRWIRTARWMLTTCANGYLGLFHTVVSGLQPASPGEFAWGALSGSAQIATELVGPVWLELGAEAIVPLSRPQFAIAGVAQPVYQQSPVAGMGTLGVRLQFR